MGAGPDPPASPADIAWAYRDFEHGSVPNRFAGVFQVETFAQFGDTVDIHLQVVPGTEFVEVFCRYLVHTAEGGKLVEEPLKSCGGNNLKDAGGLIAGIPECMPLAAWLENEVARS